MSGHDRKPNENRNRRTVVFVDAYNLIHADPMLTDALATKPEIARDHLRTLCRGYIRNHPEHMVCLVFDGDSSVGKVPHVSRSQAVSQRDGIREIFTGSDESADRRILLESRNLSGRMPCIVVSNDTEVIDTCRMNGAEILSPASFLDQSHHTRKRRAHRLRQPGAGSSVSPDKQINPRQAEDIESEMEALFGDAMDEPLEW